MALTKIPSELSSTTGIVDNSNATAITIDSNENVGIGTTSPTTNYTKTLHIHGSGTGASLHLTDPTSGATASDGLEVFQYGNDGYIWEREAGPLRFGTSALERMRIDSSGRLGIGTTSPTFKLDVAGNARANYFALRANESAPSESAFVYRPATGVLGFGTSSAERMRIDSSGNVGIGTSSPNSKLDTGGDYYSGTATTVAQLTNKISTYSTVSQGSLYGFGQDSNGLHMTAGQAGQSLMFHTGGSAERVRIDGSGNVGIGISSPSAPLHVNGDARITGAYASTTGFGANVFVQSTGKLFRSVSSARYKNSIEDATHGLEELLTLRPVTYKGNEDSDTVFGGLIAEEVHDAGLTEFVQYNEEGEPDALAYSNMVSLCIKAIQEQQTLIESLTARIAALEE